MDGEPVCVGGDFQRRGGRIADRGLDPLEAGVARDREPRVERSRRGRLLRRIDGRIVNSPACVPSADS